MERDPRIDPQEGDSVKSKRTLRHVLKRSTAEVWFIEAQNTGKERNCSLSVWQEWCKRHNANAL